MEKLWNKNECCSSGLSDLIWGERALGSGSIGQDRLGDVEGRGKG